MELFGRHELRAGMDPLEITLRDQKLVITSAAGAFYYKRYIADALKAESTIVSDEKGVTVGVFPVAPLLTPAQVAQNVYVRFKSPVVVDQRSDVVLYTKIPIEIGVYRQSGEEELLIDAFSLAGQKYALYGAPEAGKVCRFTEAEASATKDGVLVEKYTEALVRIRVANEIDNVIKISKVIIPMQGVVLDHAQDEAWVPGGIDMSLDTAFGKDIVNVRLSGTKVKKGDKTSAQRREDTLVFMMDAGY
ncbi:DUF432 domain-containing protein [Candidatus Nitrososphaera sp. FF02]|uniref:DUF432 domain-containing protein n=1 Tax=Candidatus Nitrososphaera sp. FF02 TaxID=3398226 RepID=UPI0039EAC0B9